MRVYVCILNLGFLGVAHSTSSRRGGIGGYSNYDWHSSSDEAEADTPSLARRNNGRSSFKFDFDDEVVPQRSQRESRRDRPIAYTNRGDYHATRNRTPVEVSCFPGSARNDSCSRSALKDRSKSVSSEASTSRRSSTSQVRFVDESDEERIDRYIQNEIDADARVITELAKRALSGRRKYYDSKFRSSDEDAFEGSMSKISRHDIQLERDGFRQEFLKWGHIREESLEKDRRTLTLSKPKREFMDSLRIAAVEAKQQGEKVETPVMRRPFESDSHKQTFAIQPVRLQQTQAKFLTPVVVQPAVRPPEREYPNPYTRRDTLTNEATPGVTNIESNSVGGVPRINLLPSPREPIRVGPVGVTNIPIDIIRPNGQEANHRSRQYGQINDFRTGTIPFNRPNVINDSRQSQPAVSQIGWPRDNAIPTAYPQTERWWNRLPTQLPTPN